uniref:TRAF-2 n=1 Tax=Dendrocoelum lacteum TaxID=27895 RepID=T1DF65_9PLAT
MKYSCLAVLKVIKDRSKLFYFECEQQKQRISCVKCHQVLIEPYQTQCGCRLCSNCLEECSKDEESHCPGCNETMNSPSNYSKHDKAIEKEILELNIICTNKGCEYTCKVKDLDNHLETCEYIEKRCTACNESYPRKELKKHEEFTCKMIITTCEDCGLELSKGDLEKKHKNVNELIDNVCSKWRDICPFKCSEDTLVNIKDHLLTCERRPVECSLNEMGCRKVLPREEMREHFNLEANYHTVLLMDALFLLRKEHQDLSVSVSVQNERNSAEIKELKEKLSSLLTEIEDLKTKLKQFQSMYEKLENERNLAKCSLSETKERYGEYTWKVENIMEKVNDAKKGVNTQILSESFYSSNPGYRMCLKIYPNGDGSAFGNYLSVYFVLMKGKYDDQIQWPFNSIISIRLVNIARRGEDRVLNMRPNINDQCYGRPKEEHNLAAGQPKFVSHLQLVNEDDFIKDGAIILRVNVK